MAVLALYVRNSQDDPARIHVDPFETGKSGPNSAFVAPPGVPVFPNSPDKVFDTLVAVIEADQYVEEVARGPAAYHVTFIARSRWWRFPDHISLRVLAQDDRSTVAIYARARFGYSDLGVNQARIDRWLKALSVELSNP